MDLSSIPSEYFDTRAYFKKQDKKLRERGYVVDRFGRPVKKRKLKREHPKTQIAIYYVSCGVIFVWGGVVVLVYVKGLTWGERNVCPPGFDYGECEKKDFLDTYVWKPMKTYVVNNVECKHGVAFRIWSPLVEQVQVSITDYTKTSTYNMKFAFPSVLNA